MEMVLVVEAPKFRSIHSRGANDEGADKNAPEVITMVVQWDKELQ